MSERPCDMARRLRRHYDRATPATRDAGRGWYDSARDSAQRFAAEYSVSYRIAAGIIAALSPRSQWAHNLANAERCLRGERIRAMRHPASCAQRILEGEPPELVLRGPKVRAFWRAICGDTASVTVDMWAAKAAGVDPEGLTPSRIRAIQRAYELAAASRGETPRDLQAIVWLQVRGVKPADPQGFRPTATA